MFVDVPDPVWNMSTTKWSSSVPSTTSEAAATMASAISGSSSSSSSFTWAAASLICPSARMKDLGKRRLLMGKFSAALIVCAP